MDQFEDRRYAARYKRHDRLFVQLLATAGEQSGEALDVSKKTQFCYSSDASASGLKIELDYQLAEHSRVDLWLAFEGLDKKFYLQGYICWCEKSNAEPVSYQVGVELEDAYATDYRQWIELLESFAE